VVEAAVVYDADSRLVGYLVPTGDPPTPADMRRHLAETLPAVMLPGHWVVLPDRLPRTPNGKLDRAALPEPPRHLPADLPATAGTAEPADGGGDDMVAELCAIWAEVLEVDEVRADDDLFDLGGHSLSITMIGSRIYRRFGIEIHWRPSSTHRAPPRSPRSCGRARQLSTAGTTGPTSRCRCAQPVRAARPATRRLV
jgi:hypothetical protein